MHKLASRPESINDIEHIVNIIDNEFCLNEETYGNILISLTEAVNNAIHHGNGADENKFVRIKIKRIKNYLRFRVEDDGDGFNYKNLPNPTLPENLEKCGGRGVFLITQLCDKVDYTNNGSVVEMSFKIQ